MFLKKFSLFLSAGIALSFITSASLYAMKPSDKGEKDRSKTRTIAQSIASQSRVSRISSEEHDRHILNRLRGMGLSDESIKKLWNNFQMTMSSVRAPCLASRDPYYIAHGLWRAHQEASYPQPTTGKPLPFQSMLSCLLTKEFVSINQMLLPDEVSLLGNLVRSNFYFIKFDFFRAGFTDAHLYQMGIIPNLQELSLEDNEITDEGVRTLVRYPNLRILNLSKNKITPEGVKLLSASPTLVHLNLFRNPTGDEGAEILSHNRVITYLDLRETGITDRGAIALATNNKTLKDLRLRYNKITNKGAEAFLNSRHLVRLEVSKNQIDNDLVFFLEHLMPSNAYLDFNFLAHRHSSLPSQKDRVRILSIDGGGIRGLLPAYILNYVAQGLSQRNGAPFHFAQHMDLMAGTSTGGLIIFGLAMPGERGLPKFTPQTLVDLYTTKGAEIFLKPWNQLKFVVGSTYDPIGLERILEQFFEETYISECLTNTLAVSFDLKRNAPHIFDSYEAKRDTSKRFPIKGAARATSAAPTYFPSAKIKNGEGEDFEFADGGIYVNNPTYLAIQRAQQLYPQAKEYVVYSLGTGQAAKQSLSRLGNKGLLEWGVNIADVLMDNAAEYTENLLQAEMRKDPRIKYMRIQPELERSATNMDNVTPANIETLLKAAQDTIEKEEEKLKAMIEDFSKDFGRN